MESHNNTAASLHIGDIVSIYAEGTCNGFLSTLGLLDDRSVVNSESGNLHEPPQNFSECCFKVCAAIGCSAGKPDAAKGSEPNLISELKDEARIDHCERENSGQGMDGEPVRYGQAIRLLHTRSNRYLTLEESVLCLAPQAEDGFCFSIEPPTESREDLVQVGESVMLSICHATETLGVATEEVEDRPGCRQVIASGQPTIATSWILSLFMSYAEVAEEDVLKSGDVVRLFHAEEEKFLTLDEFEEKAHVFLRTTGRETAAAAKSSKGLWEVEVINEHPCRGSTATWSSQFRFRHLATGQFLAVVDDDEETTDQNENTDIQHTLVISSRRNSNSVFELRSSETTCSSGLVPRSSSVRLRHVLTSSWIHSTAIPIDKDEEKPIMTRVNCSRVEEERETFTLIPASASEVRDLDIVNSTTQVLKKLVDSIQGGDFGRKQLETAIQLLPKIANFILSQDDGKVTTTQGPHRERQKLLREQGILRQLFEILQALLEKIKFGDEVPEKDDPQSNLHERIRRLGCEVLRLSQQKYRKNREYITDQCSLLKKRIGYYEQTPNSIAQDRPSQWNILDEVFDAIGC